MNIFGIFTIIILFFLNSLSHSQSKIMEYDGVTRSYLVHLPQNYTSDSTYPLIMVFHGWTHTPAFTETHTRMSLKADSCNFIVVYPAAIIGSNKEWNENGQYNVDDVGFIKELLDTLIKDYPIDTNKIFAAGFSDGAGMTYRMAYELPNRIAAIAPVAGAFVGTNYNPIRATPTIHFHAKNDPYSAYATVTRQITDYWQTLNNAVTDPDTFFSVNGANGIRWKGDGSTEFILYSTDIGGHSWPGGGSSWSAPSKAIDACSLLWNFFCAHPLEPITTGINFNTAPLGKSDYTLFQNYPNPFNPVTSISFNLPENNHVTLKVINLLGEEIASLLDNDMAKGMHTVTLNMNDQPSGFYLYTISSGNYRNTKKLLLLK